MVITVTQVENKLLDFIQDPTVKPDFINKEFLKVLISDVFKLNIDNFTGSERTNLYQFSKITIKHFRNEQNDKTLINLKTCLEKSIRENIAEIVEKRGVSSLEEIKQQKIEREREKTRLRLQKSKDTGELIELDDTEEPSTSTSKAKSVDDENAEQLMDTDFDSTDAPDPLKPIIADIEHRLNEPLDSVENVGSEVIKSAVIINPPTTDKPTDKLPTPMEVDVEPNRESVEREEDDRTPSNLANSGHESDTNSETTLIINEELEDPVPENTTPTITRILSDKSLEETLKDPSFQPVVRLQSITPEKVKTTVPVTDTLSIPVQPNTPETVSKSGAEALREDHTNTNSETNGNGVTKKQLPKKRKKITPRRSDKDTIRYNVVDFMLAKHRKENTLMFSTNGLKMREMSFELEPDTSTLLVTPGNSVPINQELKGLNFKDLLYWPNISLTLNFPDLEITRQLVPNIQRELIKSDPNESPVEPNDMQLKRFYANQNLASIAPQSDRDIELNHALVILYLELIMKVVDEHKLNPQSAVVILLKALLDDIKKLKRSFLNIDYSYHLNKYSYSRVFKQNPMLSSPENEKMNLKETYNPEVVFKITRCSFEERRGNYNSAPLEQFFLDLLQNKNDKAIESFHHMFFKSIIATCVQCNFKHHGNPMMFAVMRGHIKSCCAVPLSCSNCTIEGDELMLATKKWSHDCNQVPVVQENGGAESHCQAILGD